MLYIQRCRRWQIIWKQISWRPLWSNKVRCWIIHVLILYSNRSKVSPKNNLSSFVNRMDRSDNLISSILYFWWTYAIIFMIPNLWSSLKTIGMYCLASCSWSSYVTFRIARWKIRSSNICSMLTIYCNLLTNAIMSVVNGNWRWNNGRTHMSHRTSPNMSKMSTLELILLEIGILNCFLKR